MFTGTYTAIVTPFRSGAVDEDALERLIKFQIKGGVDGIVPVGTTLRIAHGGLRGTHPRHRTFRKICGWQNQSARRHGRERDELVSIKLTRKPRKSARTVRCKSRHITTSRRKKVCISISKPSRARSKLPIMLYSIPGRCGIEIGIETVKRLATDCKNIVGIKEAGGSATCACRNCAPRSGRKFTIMSGDDSLTLPFMAVGKRRHQRRVQCDSQRGFRRW